MAVGDGKAVFHISADDRIVALYGNFFYGILYSLAVLEFIQSAEAARPLSFLAQNEGLAGVLAVGKKLYGNAVRTDALGVVAVGPCLSHGNAYLLGSVAVGDIVAVIGGGVSVNCILGDAVAYELAVFVLGQVGEAP